ncbi:MAG TPA: hypothetical protein DCY27_06285 [Desulfobacterales bacterium]|nr:hypothetical protein [Desulfobacterales bacterium]
MSILDRTLECARKRDVFRILWKLSTPIALGYLCRLGLGATDAAVVGRLGTHDLAAIGISLPVQVLLWVILSMPVLALQVVACRREGASSYQAAGHALDTTILYTLAFAVVIITLALPLRESLLYLVCGDELLVGIAVPYFSILLLVMLPAALSFNLRIFYASIGYTSWVMNHYLLMVLIHIPLSISLVYGIGPCPAMGLAGAAISNLVASIAASAYLVLVGFKLKDKYGFFRLRRPDSTTVKAIYHIGLPAVVMNITAYSNEVIFTRIVSLLGVTALAANRLLFVLDSIMITMFTACAEGVVIMIGQQIGAGKQENALLVRRVGVYSGLALALLFALLVLTLPAKLLTILAGNPQAAATGVHPLRVIAAAYFFAAFATMDAAMIRAGGDNKTLMYFSLAADIFGFFPAAYCFGFLMGGGLSGAVLAFPAYWMIRMLLSRWWIGRGQWRILELEIWRTQ